MINTRWHRSLLLLIGIFLLIGLDSWLMLSSFERVVKQQAAVRNSYRAIDQLATVTSRLRDAEIAARQYVSSDDSDRHAISNAYSIVEHEMTAAVALAGNDPVSGALADKFIEILVKRRKGIDALKASRVHLNSDEVRGALAVGDDFYSELALILAKLKEMQEAGLNANLAPGSQQAVWYYLAVAFTGLLNLLVGLAAYRNAETSRRRTDLEKESFELHARELNETAAASTIVSGEIDTEQFAESIRHFFTEHFGAAAVKIYAGLAGTLRDVEVGRSVISQKSLVSQACLQGKPLTIENVPKDYWHVGSGLGQMTPPQLLILPLRFQGRGVGAIEIAFLNVQPASTLERVHKLGEVFAVSLSAAESRRRMQALLQETTKLATELQMQQEELRSTNEELEQQARSLELQQERLGEKNRELETTRGELESKATDLAKTNRYKSDFLAKMSHELRTPLNGLLILSALLSENKEKTLTAQQEKFARSINSAGNDLLNLINDILDLSKIEARKIALHPSEFTLGELFASKHRTFEPQTAAKSLGLIEEIPPGLADLRLNTDRQRLDQVLRNFMSNAIKFTERGSVTLAAKTDEARENITFTVSDTGIGIPRGKQEQIFEAFEQADSSVSGKYGGTGLGLSISKELAILLDGQIGLKSEEGKGSEFSLTIPVRCKTGTVSREANREVIQLSVAGKDLAEPASEASVQADKLHKVRDRIAQLDPGKRSILVVEDDDAFRTAVANSVRENGFEPIEVDDGSVAVELLDSFTPDAILLDIKLPGISGLGILELMKGSTHLRHVPVHMISGLEFQTNALRMGALGYLTKPVTVEKIDSALQRIENLLSRRLSRLLLIEDNSIQNDAVATLFKGNDIDVVSVATGRAGLEKVQNGSFDCIVLDLTLPDFSGFDLLAELRKLEVSLPPIVIYTAQELTEEQQEYLRKYSESIVIKGARSPDRLLDEVNLFLHRVESTLPEEKQKLVTSLRTRDHQFNGKTALIVDDDIRNIFALTSALESKGLNVMAARNGEEALKKVREMAHLDIVLMDIMMPVMDGFEAIRHLRSSADPRIRQLPIIALTAKAMREDHERCMQVGANDYLPKPINIDNLLTIMKVWLNQASVGFRR